MTWLVPSGNDKQAPWSEERDSLILQCIPKDRHVSRGRARDHRPSQVQERGP